MTSTRYRLTDELPEFNIPSVERYIGDIHTWIHAMSFRDAMTVKNLAVGHAAAKQGRQDFENVKPDEHIMKICQVILCCKTGQDTNETTFCMEFGQEVEFIDKLSKYIPKQVVDTIVSESDTLSLLGYFPRETQEAKEEKDVAKSMLLEVMTDPEIWNNLNHACVSLFGKELDTIDDNNIGYYLNLLQAQQNVQDKIIEALYEFMTVMAKGMSGIG